MTLTGTMRLGRALGLALVGFMSVVPITAAQGPSGGDRVSGEVLDVDADGTVWVDDGGSFRLAPDARVTLSRTGTPDDLIQGRFAAITATRRPDGTLRASLVRLFPPSTRISARQFPLDETNIMTNANIDEASIDVVAGSQLQVSFEDQTDTVNITLDTQIVVLQDGTTDDVVIGSRVSATVTNGTTGSVTVSG